MRGLRKKSVVELVEPILSKPEVSQSCLWLSFASMLTVVGRVGRQVAQEDGVSPCTRGVVGHGAGRAGLPAQVRLGGAKLDARLAQLLVGVPAHRDGLDVSVRVMEFLGLERILTVGTRDGQTLLDRSGLVLGNSRKVGGCNSAGGGPERQGLDEGGQNSHNLLIVLVFKLCLAGTTKKMKKRIKSSFELQTCCPTADRQNSARPLDSCMTLQRFVLLEPMGQRAHQQAGPSDQLIIKASGSPNACSH